MAITIGCCPQFKSASAFKDKCLSAFDGYQGSGKKYLVESSTQGFGVGCCAGATYTKTVNRKTCEMSEVSSCDPDDTFCDGPGAVTILSDTSKTTTGDESCCGGPESGAVDTYNLSSEYTKEMLEDDVAELIGGVDWGAIAWGEGVDLSFLDDGTVTQTEGSLSQVAAYYTDDVDDPSWVQKIALKYKPATSKICKLFYPQDGSPCTRTIEDATIGEEMTIDPPEDPGYIEVHPCCEEDICS